MAEAVFTIVRQSTTRGKVVYRVRAQQHVIRNFSTLDQGGNDPPRNRRKYVVSLASAWQRHSLAVGVGSGLCGRKRRLEVSEVASSGRGKRGEGEALLSRFERLEGEVRAQLITASP